MKQRRRNAEIVNTQISCHSIPVASPQKPPGTPLFGGSSNLGPPAVQNPAVMQDLTINLDPLRRCAQTPPLFERLGHPIRPNYSDSLLHSHRQNSIVQAY